MWLCQPGSGYAEVADTQISKPKPGYQCLAFSPVAAAPNSTHYTIAKLALEHNLHVICEKPLTYTAAESEHLKELTDACGLIFGVSEGIQDNNHMLEGYLIKRHIHDLKYKNRL